MGLNLNERVVEYLKMNPEQRYTGREIAEWVADHYPKECAEKEAKSKQKPFDIRNVLATEIGAHRKALPMDIKTIEGPPRKYYFTEKSESDEVETAEIPAIGKMREVDLYPVLYQYLRSESPVVYSKRIDEKKSANTQGKSGNHWLYPDLVGLEPLNDGWEDVVSNCVKESRAQRLRLWSFEVKLLVNRSNARECFFQAVSNSSWANFGYLVADEIAENAKKELRILSSSHGIGIIQLDSDNPTESQLMIPARERGGINWDAANRLAKENTDFRDFLRLVKQFYQIGEVKTSDWIEPTADK